MFYVYILQSLKTGSYHVGQTDDLGGRVHKHNKGEVLSTKRLKPWTLVYYEKHETRSDAVVREREIKSRKKRKYIESLIHRGVAQPG